VSLVALPEEQDGAPRSKEAYNPLPVRISYPNGWGEKIVAVDEVRRSNSPWHATVVRPNAPLGTLGLPPPFPRLLPQSQVTCYATVDSLKAADVVVVCVDSPDTPRTAELIRQEALSGRKGQLGVVSLQKGVMNSTHLAER
jgi:hypothetical protein